MFALALSVILLPTADPKEPLNPRQVAEKYLAAALADKPDDAVKFAEPGKSTAKPEKVQKFKAGISVEKLALPTVFFSDKQGYAIAVSEELQFPKKVGDLDRGVVILTLKRNKDGVWQVNDLDARSSENAAALIKKVKEVLKDAKEILPTKS